MNESEMVVCKQERRMHLLPHLPPSVRSRYDIILASDKMVFVWHWKGWKGHITQAWTVDSQSTELEVFVISYTH